MTDSDRHLGYQRQPRDTQPEDERSGRLPPHVVAGIMEGSVGILAHVLPLGYPDEPRRSTPPSPAKAAAYEAARESVAPLSIGAALAVAWVVGLILSLPC